MPTGRAPLVGSCGGAANATPAGAAGSGASTGGPPALPRPTADGPSRGSDLGSGSASACDSFDTSLPKTSGRVPASRVRFDIISGSDALLVSLILASIASRCSFHLGSMRPMRMCSCISPCRTSSPVSGDTTYSVGSYSWPAGVRL